MNIIYSDRDLAVIVKSVGMDSEQAVLGQSKAGQMPLSRRACSITAPE